MANYAEYAQRIVNAINMYGETVDLKYRISTYDPILGETYKFKKFKNYKMFIRPTDKKDWETLPEGLKIKDIRKVYFTKQLPKKELIIERRSDGKDRSFPGGMTGLAAISLSRKSSTRGDVRRSRSSVTRTFPSGRT